MKKIMALALVLCLAVMGAGFASAKGGLDILTGLLGGVTEDSGKLAELKDLFDSLKGGFSGIGGSDESAAKGMFGLLDQISGELGASEGVTDAVAASSAEDFYGTWKLSSINVGGMNLSPAMLIPMGIQVGGSVTLDAKSVGASASANGTTKKFSLPVKTKLSGGALRATVANVGLNFQLTKSGKLGCNVCGVTLYFSK